MSARSSNSVRRGAIRLAQKPVIPKAPSSRQILLQHTTRADERPRSVQREQPGPYDIRSYRPVLRRKHRTGADDSDGSIEAYRGAVKGANTSRGSSIESFDPDSGPHTSRSGSQQPVVHLFRSFTGVQGKENPVVEVPKQPKCDQHHRGLVQPRPLSTYVLTAKTSKFTSSPVAVPACLHNSYASLSFYNRLNSLEEQLERDLISRQKIRIPKGFFPENSIDD